MNSKQQLRAGERSVNVQIETIHAGLTYTDVRDMVLDLFKANFPKLREEAAVIAMERAEEITDQFLNKLADVHPEAIRNATDPDMQMALLQVQREYARSGDKELGDLLLDILVERSSQAGRSMRQLVLNEALNAAPRITVAGVNILSIIWLVKNVRYNGISEIREIYNALRRNLAPFASQLRPSITELRHLEYAGCVSLGIGESDIVDIIREIYLDLFNNGFDKDEYKYSVEEFLSSGIIMPCSRNPERLQVSANFRQPLSETTKVWDREDKKQALEELLDAGAMTSPEVEQELVEAVPELRAIIDAWRSSLMKHADLTSVGIAIGHANWRRVTSETQDIETWLT